VLCWGADQLARCRSIFGPTSKHSSFGTARKKPGRHDSNRQGQPRRGRAAAAAGEQLQRASSGVGGGAYNDMGSRGGSNLSCVWYYSLIEACGRCGGIRSLPPSVLGPPFQSSSGVKQPADGIR